jgi:hypothetical protein
VSGGEIRRRATMRRNAEGITRVSASTVATSGVRTSATALVSVCALPPWGKLRTAIRASPWARPRASAAVRSVEPSSATSTRISPG